MGSCNCDYSMPPQPQPQLQPQQKPIIVENILSFVSISIYKWVSRVIF